MSYIFSMYTPWISFDIGISNEPKMVQILILETTLPEVGSKGLAKENVDYSKYYDF